MLQKFLLNHCLPLLYAMARSQQFVDGLVWRMKTLGMPKVTQLKQIQLYFIYPLRHEQSDLKFRISLEPYVIVMLYFHHSDSSNSQVDLFL